MRAAVAKVAIEYGVEQCKIGRTVAAEGGTSVFLHTLRLQLHEQLPILAHAGMRGQLGGDAL